MVAVQVFPLFLQSCLVKLFLRIASMGCMRVRELFLVFVSFQFVFLLSSWTFGWIVLPWLANVFSSRCRCYVNFLVSLQFSLICLFMVLTTTTHRSCKTVFFYTLDFCPSPNFINFFISRFTFLCRSNSLSLGFFVSSEEILVSKWLSTPCLSATFKFGYCFALSEWSVQFAEHWLFYIVDAAINFS